MTDALEKLVHDLSRTVLESEVGDGTTAKFRHMLEQVTIDGRPDAETEDPGRADSLLNCPQNFHLVANVSICQKADEAEPSGIVRKFERRFDPSNHFCASLAVQRLQVSQPPPHVLGRCWYRSRLHF